MVVKTLNRAIDGLNSLLEGGKLSESDVALTHKKLGALKSIKEYVDGCSWIKAKPTRDKMSYYLKYGRNECKRAYNMSDSAIRNMLYYVGKVLENVITEDMVKSIMSGWVDATMLQFNVRLGKASMSDCVFPEVVAELPISAKFLDVEGCEKELTFLRDFSVANMQKRLSELDMGKLASLKSILENGSSEYLKYRQALFAFLMNSDVPLDKILDAFNKINVGEL